jgi:hypothetical protein
MTGAAPARKAFGALIAAMAVFMALRYGSLLMAPNSVLFADEGDGLKNYYTYLYHIQHDNDAWNFRGMHHPFGEHVFYTDGHPALSEVLRRVGHVFPWVATHAIGILNVLMLLGIPACACILFLLLRRMEVRPWMAAACAFGITLMAPQVVRFTGHYALSYSICLPLTWYLSIRATEDGRWSRWTVLLFLATSLWWWTHAYLGFMASAFGTLFVVAWIVQARRSTQRLPWWRSTAVLLAVGVSPLVLFRGALGLTDTHVGRTEHPSGFFDHMAEPDDLLLPNGGPVHAFWDAITGHGVRLQWEAQAYIGAAACLVLLVWPWMAWRRKRRGEDRQRMPVALGAAVWSSILLLLFAFGIPFKEWPSGLELFPVLEQFRAVGRFIWPFFFVITITAAVLLDRWTQRITARSVAVVLAALLPLAWVAEGWDRHVLARSSSCGPNVFDPGSIPLETALLDELDSGGYQAILPLPYFNYGSESFSRPRHPGAVRDAFVVSMRTGLPILAAFLTRVSVPESKKLTELVAPRFYPKALQADLADDRPILIVRSDEALTPEEADLLQDATAIDSVPGLRLYRLARTELFRDTRAEEWTRFEALRPTLRQHGRLLSNTEITFVYDDLEDRTPAVPTHHGRSAYAGDKLGTHVVLDTVLIGVPDGTPMVMSAWLYNAPSEALNLGLFLEAVQNGEEATEVRYRVDESPLIDGVWTMVELPFQAEGDAPRLVLRMDCSGHVERRLLVDEVLIRPAAADVYGVDTLPNGVLELFHNGHRIRRP